jgi:hypothetical protein
MKTRALFQPRQHLFSSTHREILENEQLMTDKPADGATPSPDGSTPSPDGSTPSPDGSTPSPDVAIPSPDVVTTSLEVGLEIFKLLSDMTKNIPYLGAITGCIQNLINVWQVCLPVTLQSLGLTQSYVPVQSMKSNKERAEALLNNIWAVSRVLVVGLQLMDPQSQSTAANLLKDDLERYQT